jgi:hypothetical protein
MERTCTRRRSRCGEHGRDPLPDPVAPELSNSVDHVEEEATAGAAQGPSGRNGCSPVQALASHET